MSREIQPVYGQGSEPRTLDPVYIKGRQGGEYMMQRESQEAANLRWIVRAKRYINLAEEAPWARIGAWDYEIAVRVLDYCVANDANARAALHKLYVEGEPDLLLELVEKAKDQTPIKYNGRFILELDLDCWKDSPPNTIRARIRELVLNETLPQIKGIAKVNSVNSRLPYA